MEHAVAEWMPATAKTNLKIMEVKMLAADVDVDVFLALGLTNGGGGLIGALAASGAPPAEPGPQGVL